MVYKAPHRPLGLAIFVALAALVLFILLTFTKATGLNSLEVSRIFGF